MKIIRKFIKQLKNLPYIILFNAHVFGFAHIVSFSID